MKNYFNKRGFTLVELIIVIALMSIIIASSFNILLLGTKTHSMSIKEYDLQSSIRIATESVNQIVRYSKAVFAVPRTFVSKEDVMDPDWSYFMLSDDGKKIISMEYDRREEKFIEWVIVAEQKDTVYEIFFEKDETSTADNLMRFVIKAFGIDKDGKRLDKEKVMFETTVESINAVQVVDKGTGISKGASPSIALAYRNDGQSSGKGRNDFAYISLIVDISGSMNEAPDGSSVTKSNGKTSRIDLVKNALTGYGTKDKQGIVQQFGKEENIYMSFVPFSLTANYPNVTANTNNDRKHDIYEVYDEENKNKLVGNINGIVAEHGTNTGDGLRRAYFLHENFRKTNGIDEEYPIHHYMILLVDGKSTYDVKNGNWNKEEYYFWGNKYYRWNWVADTKNPIYYLDDGNIKLTRPSNYLYTAQQSSDPGIKYSITGTGMETSTNLNYIGTKYVEAVGEKIKLFKDQDEEGIKSYIIGYGKDLKTNINSIGTGIGTEKDRIYSYDDPDFDINEVFQDIANDIMADFWIVTGPQIQR